MVTPMNIEFANQLQNGGCPGSVISARKLSSDGSRGIRLCELRLPSVTAAEITQNTGNRAKISAIQATTCRQPVVRNTLPIDGRL